jgi:hypothetical protein
MLRLPPRGEIAFPIPKVQRTLCTNVKRMEPAGWRDGWNVAPSASIRPRWKSNPQLRIDQMSAEQISTEVQRPVLG